MYKTKIQELCQKRSWPLPTYQNTRKGSDHNPRFTSTVTVNGFSFHTPTPTRNVKQAQNDAAMLAFLHFSLSTSPLPQHNLSLSSFPQPSLCDGSADRGAGSVVVVADGVVPASGVLQQPNLEPVCQVEQIIGAVRDKLTVEDQKNILHLYKNQLQSYVQKRNLGLPVYSSEWEGPPHAMRFKCKVTVGGQTYESDKLYSTLKDAEHAAAEVALKSLSPDGVQEGHAGLYKNLLQELVQKEGFRLPRYTTDRFGEDHMPKFVSQVEVQGEVFSGQEAKSKKQAELSAAKVAYMALKAHKGKSDAKIITGLQQPANPQSPVSPGLGNLNQHNKDKEANIITGLQHQANPKSLASPGLVNWNQPDKDEGKSDQRSFFPLSVYQVETQEISPDCSEAKFITGLQHPISTKSPACPGLVNWNQPCEDKGEFSKAKALIISTSFISSTVHQGDTHEFSPDCSEANIITGLQYQANPKSSASPGLVNWNQPNKDEVKNASFSSGSTNGSTEDSSLSIEKLTPSFSGSTKVDCESKTVRSSSCAKRVVVYSLNTNVKIEDGGALLPITDNKWVAYAYPQ